MIVNIVFPKKQEFTDVSRWVACRDLYKGIITSLDELDCTFQYLAEDTVAPYILKEFQVKHTECITVLPLLDEQYYYKKMSHTKILPDDYRDRYSMRIELPDVKFKYPKASTFRVLSEYFEKREAAFMNNMREAIYSYLLERECVVVFDSANSMVKSVMDLSKAGIILVHVNLRDRTTYAYYGGTWVDMDTLYSIIEMEQETEEDCCGNENNS